MNGGKVLILLPQLLVFCISFCFWFNLLLSISYLHNLSWEILFLPFVLRGKDLVGFSQWYYCTFESGDAGWVVPSEGSPLGGWN